MKSKIKDCVVLPPVRNRSLGVIRYVLCIQRNQSRKLLNHSQHRPYKKVKFTKIATTECPLYPFICSSKYHSYMLVDEHLVACLADILKPNCIVTIPVTLAETDENTNFVHATFQHIIPVLYANTPHTTSCRPYELSELYDTISDVQCNTVTELCEGDIDIKLIVYKEDENSMSYCLAALCETF